MKDATFWDVGQMVIHRNRQLLAFNKPAGLAVQSKEKPDLQLLANAYAKQKLFLLHRIDQPASGIVLFARNKRMAGLLSARFATSAVERSYLAVVRSRPRLNEGQESFYLTFNKMRNKAYITDHLEQAKKSTIIYRYLTSSENYHLLEIKLGSGRHHQIRAILAHIGSPIKGDVKYGDRRANRDRSIHLHAHIIEFESPTSQESVKLTAPIPDEALWQYFASQLPILPK